MHTSYVYEAVIVSVTKQVFHNNFITMDSAHIPKKDVSFSAWKLKSHMGPTGSGRIFKRSNVQESRFITITLEVGGRWQRCVNWNKVKTCWLKSPMSQQPKPKSWHGEKSRWTPCSSQASKGADVLHLWAADFWQPGTVVLLKVIGHVAQTQSNCWWWVYGTAPDGFLSRCHLNSLFWTPSCLSHLHPNQLFRSSAISHEAWINKAVARGRGASQ